MLYHFISLNKFVMQILIFFFLLLPSMLMADQEVQHLSPMIISSPLSKKIAETAHPVNLLEGDELTRKTSGTLGETLQQELGVHNRSFGAGVGQPVIRGQTGPRVRVLQNSLGSMDVSGLSPDHVNSTEPLLAERIEVLRGPATLLYGSGAIGGIVNIIDNRIPDQPHDFPGTFAFEQRFNSVSDQRTSVFKHDGGYQDFAWHLDGFYRRHNDIDIPGSAINTQNTGLQSDVFGSIPNSDAEAWSASFGGSWVEDWGFIGMSVNHLDNNYGIPPREETVRIDLMQTRYDLKAQFDNPFEGVEAIKLRLGYNDYEHVELEDGVEPATKFINDAFEARLELTHLELGIFDHGAVGMQILTRDFAAIGEEAFVPASDINSVALFMVEDIHFDHGTYEFGLRVEHQNIDAGGQGEFNHTPVSASISGLWPVSEQVSVSLALTHAQRAPDVQELLSEGVHFATHSYERGDRSLDIETSYNVDLNLTFEFWDIETKLNLFHNWSNDYIVQRNTGQNFNLDQETFQRVCSAGDECLPVFQYAQQDARFYGFEAEMTLPLGTFASTRADLILFGDYVRGKFKGGGDVPRLPPLRYGLELALKHRESISGGIRFTRAEAQRNPGENELESEGYLLLNAYLDYKLNFNEKNEIFVFVKGNNLLNEDIRNSTSFLRDYAPEPGRDIELGLRLRF